LEFTASISHLVADTQSFRVSPVSLLEQYVHAQSGEATRCTIGPMTNRAVSRSGGILHSVDGY
jgi:hypothetical protein